MEKERRKKEREHGHAEEEHGEVFDPGDMRNMGGLRKTMPVTFWLYMIGTLALAGIFPFAGFWSKDEILLDASLHFTKCLLAVDHCRILHRLLHGTSNLDGLLRRSAQRCGEARRRKPKGDDRAAYGAGSSQRSRRRVKSSV
jgi:hypothetical protein